MSVPDETTPHTADLADDRREAPRPVCEGSSVQLLESGSRRPSENTAGSSDTPGPAGGNDDQDLGVTLAASLDALDAAGIAFVLGVLSVSQPRAVREAVALARDCGYPKR